ncbi:MAG: nucleotidyltransferase domain-containing protein [Ruminococcaceae bacterium]|nr:nucleotidyltransferase domain-containing protein [Oscillospiraceae bacterium]
MSMKLSRQEIEKLIKSLVSKYHAKYAILFGSYAREDADEDSDIDVIVVGGDEFRAKDIFAFGEELRELTKKKVDAFEFREVNKDTEFYRHILQEGVRIA